MFEAYSQTKSKIVNVKDETNLNEVFLCPNPDCTAQFKITSASGRYAKHFRKTKNTQHIQTCIYKNATTDYSNTNALIKYPLDEIYNSSFSRIQQSPNSNTISNKKQL